VNPSDAPSKSPIVKQIDSLTENTPISKGAVAGISTASVVIALIALWWAGPMLWKRVRKNNDSGGGGGGSEDDESKV